MNINQSLGYLLNTSARSVKSIMNFKLKSEGITTAQWAVLKLLSEKGPLTQVAIAEHLKSDKATAGAVIEKIKKKELVQKTKSVSDKRAFNVSLTEEGEKVVNRVMTDAQEVNSFALDGLTEKQIVELYFCLNKIISNTEKEEK
ncbi:MarR family winged helix-turn-helix transcriptional regulator [Enterococcus sp. AZ109]|uniref:MarR family winged helix-turn-helix transcriptional regulator n=1 Tax=Enterococcus sp. AZ109 TaxID=2774634 RepID=UPI003F224FCE